MLKFNDKLRSKLFAVALAIVPVGAYSGCSTVLQSQQVHLIDEKALYTAELAYFGAASLIETAVDAGLLRGEPAQQVLDLETAAYHALLKARLAYNAGNAIQGVKDVETALDALFKIREILDQAGFPKVGGNE